MASRVSKPSEATINGVRYLSWTILESDPGASDEWVIEGVPAFFTLVLFEAATTDGMINPKLGLTTGWYGEDLTIDSVAENDVADQYIRNDARLRVAAPNQKLYGCSSRNGGENPTVTTRVTLIEGF